MSVSVDLCKLFRVQNTMFVLLSEHSEQNVPERRKGAMGGFEAKAKKRKMVKTINRKIILCRSTMCMFWARGHPNFILCRDFSLV